MNSRPFKLVGNAVAVPSKGGELIPASEFSGGAYGTDEVFDQISAQAFLPRLQLFGANSDAVKEAKIPMGHYGLVRAKDSIEDLGDRIEILAICWRSKAMRLGEEQVISIFNPNDPEFTKIMEESKEKDSKCLYGPEYLVWMFSTKVFATFLMGSKTARNESRNLKPLIGKAASLKVALVTNKSYKWHAPKIFPCSTDYSDQVPNIDKLREEAEKFNNPQDQIIEVAAASPDTAARER